MNGIALPGRIYVIQPNGIGTANGNGSYRSIGACIVAGIMSAFGNGQWRLKGSRCIYLRRCQQGAKQEEEKCFHCVNIKRISDFNIVTTKLMTLFLFRRLTIYYKF